MFLGKTFEPFTSFVCLNFQVQANFVLTTLGYYRSFLLRTLSLAVSVSFTNNIIHRYTNENLGQDTIFSRKIEIRSFVRLNVLKLCQILIRFVRVRHYFPVNYCFTTSTLFSLPVFNKKFEISKN